MPTILQLTRGTQRVSPISFEKASSGENKVQSIRVINFRGTKMKMFNATVTPSTGTVALPYTGASPDTRKRNKYIASIVFYGIEDPVNDKPSLSKSRAAVRCACSFYYFYSSWSNLKAGAQFGPKFKPYVRKTPPPPIGYPMKNPKNIPMLCKHLILFAKTLKLKGKITG